MKTADIVVGETYLCRERQASHIISKVKVLKTNVERPTMGYYGRVRSTVRDGVEVEVLARFWSVDVREYVGEYPYGEIVRPAQITKLWSVYEEEQASNRKHSERWAEAKEMAMAINAPVRDAVLERLKALDILDQYNLSKVAHDDVCFGDKPVSLSFSIGDLAKLLGIEGETTTTSEVFQNIKALEPHRKEGVA